MDVDTMSDIPALLERFRRGPELLAVVLTGVFGEEEDFVPAPGKWSIRQIVAHLADAEMVGAHRFRQVIAEDNPTLVAFDQDAWARNLDYARRKPKQSLETFRRIRAENYELLKGLPETVFERAGNHTAEWTDDPAPPARRLRRPRRDPRPPVAGNPRGVQAGQGEEVKWGRRAVPTPPSLNKRRRLIPEIVQVREDVVQVRLRGQAEPFRQSAAVLVLGGAGDPRAAGPGIVGAG